MCLQGVMKFHHCLLKILRKNQNVTDGQTERRTSGGQTDRQRENSIAPTNTVCWGYKYVSGFQTLNILLCGTGKI